MSEALLIADLKSFMRGHLGKEKAVPRRALLAHLHALGHTVTDRTLRRAYAEIPQIGYSVEGDRRGLFWITSRDEAHGVERCEKAEAELERVKPWREIR